MPFVSEWSTTDQRNLVVFAPDVLRVFKNYRQRLFWQPEGGGILLGRRRGKHLEVVLATEPSPKDRRATFSFVREANGHAEFAELAWHQGDKKIDYLGEWHTHPENVPNPSGVDRREWGKLVAQRPNSTLLVVVVGINSLHVEIIDRGQEKLLAPLAPK
ncbi:Mov34/MPN/PAD-1 family protein [Bordetella bronchiseptica]|uniref:Mov34/MPN/PAD-1 family protein n=1 Tax=Bordetella bronchiseptica TaxID=518 RepID=UPI0009B82131|nr:Mov34/MPN/PAD-1 family protein [Bordetella bronchiseptica]